MAHFKTSQHAFVWKLLTLAVMSLLFVGCSSESDSNTQPNAQMQAEDNNQPDGTIVPVENPLPDNNTIPDEGNLPVVPQTNMLTEDGSWQVGEHVFSHVGPDTSALQDDSRSSRISILLADRDSSDNAPNYAVSVLNVIVSSLGSGEYAVTDSTNASIAISNGAMAAWISVIITDDDSQGGVRWESLSTSGTLTITVDAEGHYYASSVEPILMTRVFDFAPGIPDSPDLISLSFRNVNGTEFGF